MNGHIEVIHPEIVEMGPGRDTDPKVLEAAYQLWAWELNQNANQVAAQLGLHGKTVRRWVQRENWRLRYEDERAELTPGLARYATARQIQNGLPGAVAFVEAVASGTVDANLPGVKPRLIACKMLMDAAGFAPIHYTGEIAKPQSAAVEGLPDLATLSLEQVEALEAQYTVRKALPEKR